MYFYWEVSADSSIPGLVPTNLVSAKTIVHRRQLASASETLSWSLSRIIIPTKSTRTSYAKFQKIIITLDGENKTYDRRLFRMIRKENQCYGIASLFLCTVIPHPWYYVKLIPSDPVSGSLHNAL